MAHFMGTRAQTEFFGKKISLKYADRNFAVLVCSLGRQFVSTDSSLQDIRWYGCFLPLICWKKWNSYVIRIVSGEDNVRLSFANERKE